MSKQSEETLMMLDDNAWPVRVNRWTLATSRHYLSIMLIVLGIFVGLPFAAPVLMHLGLTGPGELIYSIYSPLCHQFAFRSWFFFGEQFVYPRAAAHIPGLQPYESYLSEVVQVLGDRQDNTAAALELNSKYFLGDASMGYKVAICERDTGIYLALFFGGLIYSIPYVRRRLRPVPIWLYIVVGLGPIGLDGFSQLLSYPPFELWPLRESTPVFRLLTGVLFGLMNAWLAFPYLEQSARDVIKEIEAKFEKRRQRQIELTGAHD
jgi:uncharacterized membrane protein